MSISIQPAKMHVDQSTPAQQTTVKEVPLELPLTGKEFWAQQRANRPESDKP